LKRVAFDEKPDAIEDSNISSTSKRNRNHKKELKKISLFWRK